MEGWQGPSRGLLGDRPDWDGITREMFEDGKRHNSRKLQLVEQQLSSFEKHNMQKVIRDLLGKGISGHRGKHADSD